MKYFQFKNGIDSKFYSLIFLLKNRTFKMSSVNMYTVTINKMYIRFLNGSGVNPICCAKKNRVGK